MSNSAFLHPSQASYIECELAYAASRESAFASDGFCARLDAVLAARGAGRPILSLDVFDTLLLRDNTSELRRFVEIGAIFNTILNEVATETTFSDLDGFLARAMGTDATYSLRPTRNGCREGSLAEIIEVACHMMLGHASDQICERLRRAELQYEAQQMSVSEFWLDRIARHKDGGGMCILISDMYMHSTDIADLLELLSVDLTLFDEIFSSADTSLPKHAGTMFEYVQNVLDAEPDAFFHVGDALVGDYQNPRKAGWAALHLPIPEAEIAKRVQDHDDIETALKRDFGYQTHVASPSTMFS